MNHRHLWRDNPCEGTHTPPIDVVYEPAQKMTNIGGLGRGTCPACNKSVSFSSLGCTPHKALTSETVT